MDSLAKRPKTGGRKKGTPNKVGASAREVIAAVIEGQVGNLGAWISEVANGRPMVDGQGLYMLDDLGRKRWEVPPNPVKAFEMVNGLLEFNMPKLARQELTGAEGGPLQVHIHLDE